MARIGGDGPTDRAWRAAVVAGLALIAGAFAFAVAYPYVFGACPCRDRDGRLVLAMATSRDLWIAVDAARYVANGALGYVYESTPYLTSLPLWPILLAPLVAAGDALGLSAPPAPAASLYLLVAPATVGLAVPLLHQVRGLVRDAGDRRPALSLQLWTALLVAVPVLVVCGHGEDGLALAALLGAVRLAAGGRPVAAGLLLGVAIASKQWAVLALPALLAAGPRRERAGLAAASLALPAALATFTLAVDWPHASLALLHPPNYPGYGHAAPWVDAGAATVVTAPFRLAVLVLAVALAGRARGGRSRLVAVLGLTLLARCAFEPVLHVYYLAPGLCLLLVHERMTTGRCARTVTLGVLLLAWWPVRPAPALWWAVTALLGAAVAYRAAREVLTGTAERPADADAEVGLVATTAARHSSVTGSHQ